MDQNKNIPVTSVYDYSNDILMNPGIIIILVVIVVIYIALFSSLGGESTTNDDSDKGSGSNMVTGFVILILIILAILNGAQYFMGIDIVANIKNMFSNHPEIDIAVINTSSQQDPIPEIKFKKQVFNIPGNNYVYPDAKALCTAYGADLANYKQVEDSYNGGGEWCNYGWSDGQMALFPTQQKSYDELQKIPGHENDCGRPGINGGYMANPALKFGVNCYGYKPRMTTEEEDLMQTMPHYPKTKQDIAMEKRVDYWKTRLTDILVSPFNYSTWSKI